MLMWQPAISNRHQSCDVLGYSSFCLRSFVPIYFDFTIWNSQIAGDDQFSALFVEEGLGVRMVLQFAVQMFILVSKSAFEFCYVWS
jgi:hypothetical protein